MEAGKFSNMLVFFVIAAAALQFGSSVAQTRHVVGDALGWTTPPGGPIAYSTWASRRTFTVGDVLVFNWNSTHTVTRVSKEAYDSCNVTNTLDQVYDTSPVNFTINNGSQYFICTISNHCRLGQKVTITVGPSNGASSAAATAALSAIASAIAISFLSFM